MRGQWRPTGVRWCSGGPADTTHFGFKTVPLTEKQGKVNEVFHGVANKCVFRPDVVLAPCASLIQITVGCS